MKISGLIQRRIVLPLAVAGLAISFVNPSQAQTGSQDNSLNTTQVVLPSGTVVPVVLDTSISSKDSQTGDKFSGTVKSGSDDAGLPQGTRIEGIIQEAIASGSGKPGVLDFDFRRIIFPNGDARTIKASLYSLDGKAVKRTDGRLVATSDKSKDRLKWVGIGAGGGLLIGALTKQNELLSAILGAGAGYLFNELSNKKSGDVNLKQGATFGVRLDSQLAYNTDGKYNSQRTAQNGSADQSSADHQRQIPINDRTSYGQRTYMPGDNNDIGMTVNDHEVRFKQSAMPYMRGSNVMVPLAAVGRNADFDYRYVSKRHLILARNDSIRLVLGSRVATVDGERRRMPVAAEMHHGSIYVPMQFIDWAADGSAKWDPAERMITLNTASYK